MAAYFQASNQKTNLLYTITILIQVTWYKIAGTNNNGPTPLLVLPTLSLNNIKPFHYYLKKRIRWKLTNKRHTSTMRGRRKAPTPTWVLFSSCPSLPAEMRLSIYNYALHDIDLHDVNTKYKNRFNRLCKC
jgi:hypothetical protein